MYEDNKLRKQVEETLGCLEGIKKAPANPYFYARLQVRLMKSKEDVFERISYYITRPSFAFAGISLILLINLLVMSPEKQPDSFVAGETERVYSSEEYTLAVSSFYSMETELPY